MADRNLSKTIYAGMKLRTTNRSEYDDNLLRNNQRYDNRLQQEIQAVERAQRIIAKGLDKESQFFRQKVSTSSLTSSGNYRKKNSFSEQSANWSYAGNGYPSASRLVPDYQIHGKPGSSMSHSSGASHEDTVQSQSYENATETKERKHRDRGHGESESSHSRRKSKSKEADRKSRHNDKRSSRSRKTKAEDGSEAKEDAAHASRDNVTSAEPSTGVAMQSLGVEGEEGKRSRMSSASSPRVLAATPDTGAKTPTEKPPTPQKHQTITTTDRPTSSVTAASKSASLNPDLNWDGRRRYANIWDMLSTPKSLSTQRAVRSRLEQELGKGGENKSAKSKP